MNYPITSVEHVRYKGYTPTVTKLENCHEVFIADRSGIAFSVSVEIRDGETKIFVTAHEGNITSVKFDSDTATLTVK